MGKIEFGRLLELYKTIKPDDKIDELYSMKDWIVEYTKCKRTVGSVFLLSFEPKDPEKGK